MHGEMNDLCLPRFAGWRLFHAAIASTLIIPSISVLESWFWRGEEDKALRGRNLSAVFNPKSLSLLTNHIPACLRRPPLSPFAPFACFAEEGKPGCCTACLRLIVHNGNHRGSPSVARQAWIT